MKVTLTEMHSIRDAIRTMYMSKRTWNVEIEQQLKEMVDHCTDRYGRPLDLPEDDELKIKFDKEVAKLLKWGQKHITMLRFEDISVVVEGLHRGATDDLDSHAKRMDNRIIRSSTRLADYHEGEVSEWYEDKIITWDEVLKYLGTKIPGESFRPLSGSYISQYHPRNPMSCLGRIGGLRGKSNFIEIQLFWKVKSSHKSSI